MQIVIAGTADEVATRVLGRDAWAAFERRPPLREGNCRCGLWQTYLVAGQCVRCHEEHEWSRQNRAWCAGLHRGIWASS